LINIFIFYIIILFFYILHYIIFINFVYNYLFIIIIYLNKLLFSKQIIKLINQILLISILLCDNYFQVPHDFFSMIILKNYYLK